MNDTAKHVPATIEVRGARVHNLKNIDVSIPLHRLVGIAGVSGSGKSSLALGVLYAEGSRRYLDALSTYTRRRISQTGRASVDEVLHVPAALALRQRPGVPGVHSTFGTSTELFNYLRLMFSRLGSHMCPNGHHAPPSMAVALDRPIVCPACGVSFRGPGAEDLAFNSTGACQTCGGTGTVRCVDESTLVPDESLTIDEGAVAPWRQLMWSLMTQVCGEMGVRTDVPFRELNTKEREIVFHGPAVKKHILYRGKNGQATELGFTYYSAVHTVENALSKAKDEAGLARVAKFLIERTCPDCGGSRLSGKARSSLLGGMDLAQAATMTLDELAAWVPTLPAAMPDELRKMAETIVGETAEPIQRLQQLGLGYLALDRASSTLSTGERQRVQLSRAVRNRTTGVLYVLDEPSIGLHPSNVEGLLGVVDDLLSDGNSVVLVDHDVRVLRHADHIIEIGPKSGAEGGRVIAQGSVADIEATAGSRIGPFLSGERKVRVRGSEANATGGACNDTGGAGNDTGGAGNDINKDTGKDTGNDDVFANGVIELHTDAIHTVKPLDVMIPRGRLTAVTGVSGSGKTTMVLESLIPALKASIDGASLPAHVRGVTADGIRRANLIDATPIGANVRSTVATYSGVLDYLRRAYAKLPVPKTTTLQEAAPKKLTAGAFSYNTGSLRCPTCDGTGQISLDVQFLPDVDIPCPDCGGSRYGRDAYAIRRPVTGDAVAGDAVAGDTVTGDTVAGDTVAAGKSASGAAVPGESVRSDLSLPELLELTVDQARDAVADLRTVRAKLDVLHDLGLGYLTLGEATPALSGGEAQRLKLASELTRRQDDALFVFDEPTIGLHPLDVEVLLNVLQRLIDNGATVVVIEHDLDMIANADYIIDMGPGGGESGGRVVCAGTPEQVAADPASVTGRYLAEELR